MLNPVTPQNARNHEELENLLRDINTLPEGANPDEFENLKFNKILDFLKSESSVGINGEDFVMIIKGADFKFDFQKNRLIDIILNSERSSEINFEGFVEIIKSAQFNNDVFKLLSIQNFLSSKISSGISCNDFVEIIKGVEFKEESSKFSCIESFLESERSEGITSENFLELIKGAEIGDNDINITLIYLFLVSNRSTNITPKDLAKIIKEVGLQNQAEIAFKLYETKFSASENYIENFIDITKTLQPSEAMQCEFVKEFIKQNQINQGNVMGLKPFIDGLQDNELALDLIEILSRGQILVNEKDTLSLVKNRSKKQYAFLTEIVGDKILEDCINSGGIATLKATFGEDLKVGDQPITVSDLISYYDIKNETSTLFAMIKPEFKKELRDNFSPSADMLLYKPVELDKLNQLMGERGVSFNVKNYLLENAKLCDYLKEKVGNVEEIDSSKTYQINFINFGIVEEKQAELNTLFNELLKSNNPDKERVENFFSDLLGIGLSDIDVDKLKTFFQQNKKELAHCFCNKEISKEDFKNFFTTIDDGCFANIGTQFKKMLYGTMIKDEDAQILYAVADDKIFSGIINTYGSDILFDNFNPINNAIIKSYYLSPMVLVKKLSEEEMLTPTKSWDVIGKIAGDDKKNEIFEKLSESYSDTTIFNQKAKEIASFLIVKEIVGEEKIKDLTSKNPQLKELGDFVYDRAPEPSPRNLQQQDPDAPRVSCLFRCLRR